MYIYIYRERERETHLLVREPVLQLGALRAEQLDVVLDLLEVLELVAQARLVGLLCQSQLFPPALQRRDGRLKQSRGTGHTHQHTKGTTPQITT